MKKYILIILIISLISFTTFIKNSSKSLENKIYNKKEAIVLLDEAYNLASLENNYLTSSKKLFDYLEDLQEVLERLGSLDEVPDGIPESHFWWFIEKKASDDEEGWCW